MYVFFLLVNEIFNKPPETVFYTDVKNLDFFHLLLTSFLPFSRSQNSSSFLVLLTVLRKEKKRL